MRRKFYLAIRLQWLPEQIAQRDDKHAELEAMREKNYLFRPELAKRR